MPWEKISSMDIKYNRNVFTFSRIIQLPFLFSYLEKLLTKTYLSININPCANLISANRIDLLALT